MNPTSLSVSSSVPLGCGVAVSVRAHLHDPMRPVVLMSSGFGYSSFDKPLPSTLIALWQAHGLNWLQYVYAEREPGNPSQDLLLSSAVHTLRALRQYLRGQGYSRHALYGNSFGANISVEAALLEPVLWLILSSPVIDFARYRERQLGGEVLAEWKQQGTARIQYENGTVESSYRFMQEARHQRLAERCGGITCPVQLLFSEKDPIVDATDRELFRRNLPSADQLVLPQGTHTIRDEDSLALVSVRVDRFLNTCKE